MYVSSVCWMTWNQSPLAGICAALEPRLPPVAGILRSSPRCARDSLTTGSILTPAGWP